MAKENNSHISKIIGSIGDWMHNNYWVLTEIILIIAGCYFFNKILSRFINKLKTISQRKKAFWDETLLKTIENPIKVTIWLIGLTFIFDAINHQIRINFLKFSPIIRYISLITLVSWVIISFISAFEDNLIKGHRKTKFDRFTADFTAKILKILVSALGVLATLEIFGFNISGIIALGGIGGAALAFASQNLLSNFFGTVIIYLDKPFSIGDKILIKGENLKGYVEEIGWRITKIRTLDQLPVYIQNAVFSKDSIINYSRITHKKLSEKIGVTAINISQVKGITEKIRVFLEEYEDVDKEYNIVSVLTDFGQDFIEINVEAVIKIDEKKEFVDTRQDIMLNIFNIIKDNECQVLFSNDNKQLLTKF